MLLNSITLFHMVNTCVYEAPHHEMLSILPQFSPLLPHTVSLVHSSQASLICVTTLIWKVRFQTHKTKWLNKLQGVAKVRGTTHTIIEERPPLWRVAANKLSKQSWTADKVWSSRLGVGRGANNPSL